jgi:hypothetical protein
MDYSVDIDKNNLDEESITVPALFDMFQKEESIWSAKWDALKDQLSVAKADINLQIRGWKIPEINSFFKLKLDKTTEDVYKNLVLIHPKIIQIMNEIVEAQYNTTIFQSARKAIETKTASLDRLARLHGQGYFMKIDGRPYKRLAADAAIKKASEVIIQRIKQEKTPKPVRIKPSNANAMDL